MCRIEEPIGPHDALVEFTARFVAETGAAAPEEAFAFGDDPSQADELARLVVAGPKRATTALLDDFRTSGEQLPVPRDTATVLDGRGRPVCVIRTSFVEVRTLNSVDPSYA